MANKRVALVTGAGAGIGKGIVLALAEANYDVVLTDINLENCEQVAKEAEEMGAKTLALKCDVSNGAEVTEVFSQVKEKFGKLDVLVNNAGIYPFKAFEEMEEDDWHKVMSVNVKGVYSCTKAAVAMMSEGGRVIDVSSIASVIGFPGLVHYCASKGAVNAMVRALALELASKQITVNAVAPGAIATPGAQSTLEAQDQLKAAIPLKRIGEPADIANAVVFLASEKSSYITGQVLVVDGGWTIQ